MITIFYRIVETDLEFNDVYSRISDNLEKDYDDPGNFSLTCRPLTFEDFSVEEFCEAVNQKFDLAGYTNMIGIPDKIFTVSLNTVGYELTQQLAWNVLQAYGLRWSEL